MCLILNIHSYSQYYETGQEPSNIKWYSYQTENFTIIHQQDFTNNAILIGNLLEQAINKYPDIKIKRRLKVVIHSSSISSNGIVAWAPARMELYPIFEPSASGNHPFEELAKHELRHVVQLRRVNKGMTRFLSFIFGEHIIGGILGLYIPMWFLEGDAVVEETNGTVSGRGTNADFTVQTRAMLLNNKMYSFNKMSMGSYKDNLPDAYEFGYTLLSYTDNYKQSELRDYPIVNSGKNPYAITPFNKGIKKSTGLSKRKYYNKVFNELQKNLKAEQNTKTFESYNSLNQRKKNHNNNYINPFTYNNNLYCLKTGQTSTNQIIKIDNNKKEKCILKIGYENSNRIYSNNQFITWSEIKYDVRWTNRQYSIIKIYNLKTNSIIKLKGNTRYFSPAITNDGNKICVVEYTTTNNVVLKIIDVKTNKTIKEKNFGNYANINHPSWNKDASKLYFILVENNAKYICSYNLENDSLTYHFGGVNKGIEYPVVYDENKIIYSAINKGIRNIYLFSLDNKKHYKLTNTMYGATLPFVYADTLYFSKFNYYGYDLAKIYIDRTQLEEVVFESNIEIRDSKSESLLNMYDTIPINKIKRYRKGTHLFNVHSWAPFYYDLDKYTANPGLTLISQDVLSTTISKLYYEYNSEKNYNKAGFNIEYKGFFPVIGFDSYLLNKNISNTKRYNLYYNSAYFSIPLFFKSRNSNFNIGISSRIEDYRYKNLITKNTKEKFYASSNRIFFKHSIDKTQNDIDSKFMQYLDINYKLSAFNIYSYKFDENVFAIKTLFNFPGIFNHDILKLRFEYQKNKFDDIYYFSNIISIPKGVADFFDENMATYSIMYATPLLYPDISIGSIAYIKRIILNPYFENINYGKGLKHNIYSYGANLTTETHLFRTIFPFEIGVRINKVYNENFYTSYFIFNIMIQ
ncbi:MAG: hypothetical protein A2X12_05625 [Bacteroidetes bacterium GWE2_29_8]|nr:MAG: hypothetical protein A2X12_05625 [Bacteroidetes bacterium GWE2_29_8]OFY23764.1 MAG: hypothetical protein A2X02_03585 [Bacteroidetes bacterium GWF2_29_10]